MCCAGQEQGHPWRAFLTTPECGSMTQPTPPVTPARTFVRRYGVWMVILVAFIAGIVFYFRYEGSLAPMLGGRP